MDTLGKLFGSQTRVKLMKLFLFNPDTPFDSLQATDRTKEPITKVRKELLLLEKVRLVKRKVFFKTEQRKRGGRKVTVKTKAHGFVLNEHFEFLAPLHTFLINWNHLTPKDIARKLHKAGNIKLVLVAGIFIHDPESRVDLLVVGDHLKKGTLDSAIKTIESEIGKEIRYAAFETPDFQYRLGLYDKLVRDILDFPHEKVLNKIGLI